MKTISFEKLNFESNDILSRLQMKKVKGGHGGFCSCSCLDGTSWDYTAKGDPNTPVQPSSNYLHTDAANTCGGSENVAGCNGCTNW